MIVFMSFIIMILPHGSLFAAVEGPDAGGKSQSRAVLREIVITAPPMQTPLETIFNPKAAEQPVPAEDGAAYLKNIPGMSVIRKGGTDGDPVFRGMAGSRLGILVDGQTVLGGCGARMDPPTAYIYPEAYDRVTLVKGPETVIYGPGMSAGVVLFDRVNKRFKKPGMRFFGSVMGGSFGRNDEVLDVTGGTPLFYIRGTGLYSHSDDYRDGDGNKVHSKWTRWNSGGTVGWTPDNDTRLEFSTTQSDGNAAYADRAMDGVKFARQDYRISFEKKHVSSWIDKMEAMVYYNHIDHVMDNFSLRTFVPTMQMPHRSAINPGRETTGGRLAFTTHPFTMTKLIFGMDALTDGHSLRSTMNEDAMPYESMPRADDARFNQVGLFAQGTRYVGRDDRIIAGLRGDWWTAQDKRQTLSLSMGMSVPNPTANARRDEALPSGFVRYEHDLEAAGATLYAGVGHSERFPDYWELIGNGNEGPTASDRSAFDTTRPEKTTQLDVGGTLKKGRLTGFVSGFANKINDFILIQSDVVRTSPARTVVITRNIDATTWGGEAGSKYSMTPNLTFDASIAYTHGENNTEDRPLAQIPPLEGKIGVNWHDKTWSFGSLLRLVASQHRFALDEGNIAGQDIGPSSGFAVLSVNGGWTPEKGLIVSAGIDNLLDKTYAEFISRSGAMVPGFVQTARVNEPGRTFWSKVSYEF
ncbi:MAG: TonB-dependent copper receptor [Nitrospiraceae bacterium]|nr:TonB-dependent copper receptor [Nitrospiraceae bacterium]